MTSGMNPDATVDVKDVDSEAVADELDVDTEAPLDETTPTQPDSERVAAEVEEPENGV